MAYETFLTADRMAEIKMRTVQAECEVGGGVL